MWARLPPLVLQDCAHQILRDNRSIIGAMVESFLVEGNQPIPEDLSTLRYGCSVTDACIGWEDSEQLLRELAAAVRERRQHSDVEKSHISESIRNG